MNQVYAFTELNAYVINQIHTGSTFAVNESDSSEQIFIPSQIARMQNIVPGDRVSVRAIPNKHNGGAKWFAVFAAPIPAGITPQIELARPAPAVETNIMEALEAWESKEAAPTPPPEPKRETVTEIRELVELLLATGGMWTVSQIRDELWPNEEFGTGDYRYKTLTNLMGSMHSAGEVAVVGRRQTMRGLMSHVHYTKQPHKVRFVWED